MSGGNSIAVRSVAVLAPVRIGSGGGGGVVVVVFSGLGVGVSDNKSEKGKYL